MDSLTAGYGSITRDSLESWLAGPHYRALLRQHPDAAQDAILALLELLKRGADPLCDSGTHERQARLGGYLRTTHRRQTAREHRKWLARLADQPEEIDTDTLAFTSRTPELEYEERERLRQLGLSAEEAVFLAQGELLGPSDDELAASLGVPKNTLQARRSRRRAQLLRA